MGSVERPYVPAPLELEFLTLNVSSSLYTASFAFFEAIWEVRNSHARRGHALTFLGWHHPLLCQPGL
jgi:hypothetical protein